MDTLKKIALVSASIWFLLQSGFSVWNAAVTIQAKQDRDQQTIRQMLNQKDAEIERLKNIVQGLDKKTR